MVYNCFVSFNQKRDNTMQMKKGEASRAKLVACAAELFWRQGYNATGLSEILQAASLPKGSFYFYFKGKKDMAAAVIEYYRRIVSEDMKQMAEGRDWREFVHALTRKHLDSAAEGEHNGCPFAVMGMELALSEPEIAELYAAALDEARQIMAEVLERSGLNHEDARALSSPELTLFEGKLMLFRISGDAAHLEAMGREMIQVYEQWEAQHEH
jgi:AcrR family transcriptional regulator